MSIKDICRLMVKVLYLLVITVELRAVQLFSHIQYEWVK
jgi:hypothetical protein